MARSNSNVPIKNIFLRGRTYLLETKKLKKSLTKKKVDSKANKKDEAS